MGQVMNEQIKKLAIKAGGEFWQRLENDTVNPEAYITFDPPDSLEKFAELIVKECMEQVWYTREDGINGNVSEVIKDRIKQHFGVEE
jgi:hypothetical protein